MPGRKLSNRRIEHGAHPEQDLLPLKVIVVKCLRNFRASQTERNRRCQNDESLVWWKVQYVTAKVAERQENHQYHSLIFILEAGTRSRGTFSRLLSAQIKRKSPLQFYFCIRIPLCLCAGRCFRRRKSKLTLMQV